MLLARSYLVLYLRHHCHEHMRGGRYPLLEKCLQYDKTSVRDKYEALGMTLHYYIYLP